MSHRLTEDVIYCRHRVQLQSTVRALDWTKDIYHSPAFNSCVFASKVDDNRHLLRDI